MLDNTEEAACAIDFVDDSVKTQNIKVCTDDEIAPATETDNFSIQLDTPGSIVKKKFVHFVREEEIDLPCVLQRSLL